MILGSHDSIHLFLLLAGSIASIFEQRWTLGATIFSFLGDKLESILLYHFTVSALHGEYNYAQDGKQKTHSVNSLWNYC